MGELAGAVFAEFCACDGEFFFAAADGVVGALEFFFGELAEDVDVEGGEFEFVVWFDVACLFEGGVVGLFGFASSPNECACAAADDGDSGCSEPGCVGAVVGEGFGCGGGSAGPVLFAECWGDGFADVAGLGVADVAAVAGSGVAGDDVHCEHHGVVGVVACAPVGGVGFWVGVHGVDEDDVELDAGVVEGVAEGVVDVVEFAFGDDAGFVDDLAGGGGGGLRGDGLRGVSLCGGGGVDSECVAGAEDCGGGDCGGDFLCGHAHYPTVI